MSIVTVSQLYQHVDKKVELRGWVYNTRSIGKIWFLILRDGTGLLQCVAVKDQTHDESFALEQSLNKEDSVIVTGIVREEPRSPGGFELGLQTINVLKNGNKNEVIIKVKKGLYNLATSSPKYQCKECGFSSQHLLWHCPSCKNWETQRPFSNVHFDSLLQRSVVN